MLPTHNISTETIFTHYAAVERYYRQLKSSINVSLPAVKAVNALDVYLMHLLATMNPTPISVIDLTGPEALGGLAYSWLYHVDTIGHLIAGQLSWQPDTDPWQTWLPAVADLNHLPTEVLTILDAPIDTEAGARALKLALNPLAAQMVIISGLTGDRATIDQRLGWLIDHHPRAIIVIGPLGAIGDSVLISTLIDRVTPDNGGLAPYRFAALREVSPFFANAQYGVLYPAEAEWVTFALKRIRDIFDGNFNYLTLLAQNYKLHEQSLQTQTQTVSLDTSRGNENPEARIVASNSTRLQLVTRQSRDLAVRTLKTIRHRADPYHITYLEVSVPNQIQIGSLAECRVSVRNDSTIRWAPLPGTIHSFNISYHWYSKDGVTVMKEAPRTGIPPLDPGQSIAIDFTVGPPGEPGEYILELDTVYEGYSWFSDATGLHGPRFTLKVVL